MNIKGALTKIPKRTIFWIWTIKSAANDLRKTLSAWYTQTSKQCSRYILKRALEKKKKRIELTLTAARTFFKFLWNMNLTLEQGWLWRSNIGYLQFDLFHLIPCLLSFEKKIPTSFVNCEASSTTINAKVLIQSHKLI
jgi:hypothetical protein